MYLILNVDLIFVDYQNGAVTEWRWRFAKPSISLQLACFVNLEKIHTKYTHCKPPFIDYIYMYVIMMMSL